MEFSKVEHYKEDNYTESKRYMVPLSQDFPRYTELKSIYNGKEHSNIITPINP